MPGKVTGPAIGLMAVGGINGLVALLGLVMNLLGFNNGPPPPNIAENPQMLEFYNQLNSMGPVLNIVIGLISILAAGTTVFGGYSMMQGKGYGLAITASIIAMIPCLGLLGCCGIGQGIGIWAIIVLMDQSVKQLFR